MTYTINQLAKLAGISVRTLHYYDHIGLLRPSFTRPNGYRVYEDKELLKLQQILLFRELEFPLEEIRAMMAAKNFDVRRALRDQRKMLEVKRRHIETLIDAVDSRLKGGEHMADTNSFGAFTDKTMDEFKEEARKRWGHTDAYKQSVERTKHWTKEDYNRIAEEGTKFTETLAKLMDRGIDDAEVQRMIEQHYQGIRRFYDCPLDMYKNLGSMYVDDPRFTAYYDKFRKGMAVFMRDAIDYYVGHHA